MVRFHFLGGECNGVVHSALSPKTSTSVLGDLAIYFQDMLRGQAGVKLAPPGEGNIVFSFLHSV